MDFPERNLPLDGKKSKYRFVYSRFAAEDKVQLTRAKSRSFASLRMTNL
jgi:hypothetical protein